LTTIRDVAERAGVSCTTVSHVINKTRPVSKDTIQMVKEAIRALHYVPNSAARGLRRGQSRMIGVVNTMSIDPYFGEILSGIETEAMRSGFQVISSATGFEGGDEADYIQGLASRGVEALILSPRSSDSELKESLARFEGPVLLAQRRVKGLRADVFLSRDYEGTTEAMRHLIGLGHRRIALVGGQTYPGHAARERERAWGEAMISIGAPPPDDYFAINDYSLKGTFEAVRGLLARGDRPSALMFYSDLMAFAGIAAARSMGLRVPEDLSVIGYDDIELSAYADPPLTTVRQVKFEAGVAMARRAIERIAAPKTRTGEFAYPTSLVLRASTAKASS
jgi:LacI family transcriptional regulator